MGHISQKLVAEMLEDVAVLEDAETTEEERRGINDMFLDSLMNPDEFHAAEHDPRVAHLVAAQTFAAMFAEWALELEEFEEYSTTIEEMEGKYRPEGPPISPLTQSYFHCWALFDLEFGDDRETIGSCLLELLKAMEAHPFMRQTMRHLCDSRMGIYEQVRRYGDRVWLRELITGDVFACHSTTGYTGNKGQLWYVRLCPSLYESDRRVVVTTPYILDGASVEDWTAYLNKSLLNRSGDLSAALHCFMKRAKPKLLWHDFVMQAFSFAQKDAIFLRGLPDVPSSMPRANCKPFPKYDGRDAEQLDVQLTRAQRRIAAELSPEISTPMQLKYKKPIIISLLRGDLRRLAALAEEALKNAKGTQRMPLRRIVQLGESDQLNLSGDSVYQLYIELVPTNPPVWRRIEVRDCALDDLHRCIQIAMGWENVHLYHFAIGDERFTPSLETEGFFPSAGISAEDVGLSDVIPLGVKRFSFEYAYDFGDRWSHAIEVESVVPASPRKKYPSCLSGERACPPEDCGGIWGYYRFLDALEDPKDAENEDWLDMWGPFDPDAFDPKRLTGLMRQCLPDM